jgi:hypothetical protein
LGLTIPSTEGGGIMAHIQPWHSKRVNDREVYHDDSACAEGSTIAGYNRAPGTGGRPRCEQCQLAQGSK